MSLQLSDLLQMWADASNVGQCFCISANTRAAVRGPGCMDIIGPNKESHFLQKYLTVRTIFYM